MRIAFATCAEVPAGDPDDQPLAAALGAEFAVWDDPSVAWEAFDRVIVRSTWDYHERPTAYLAWAERVGSGRLVNPPHVLRWNADKAYLADLAQAGVPVVQTALFPPGTPFMLSDEMRQFVIKPTVSAGSRDTARFDVERRSGDGARAIGLAAHIHESGRTVMVQPYVASVDERGETALIYLDGVLSHAIVKGPMLAHGSDPTSELYAPEEIAPREPTAREREVGDRAMACVAERFGGTLPYARADLVQGSPDDNVLLLELELMEPSLFLAHGGPAALERAVAALGRPEPVR